MHGAPSMDGQVSCEDCQSIPVVGHKCGAGRQMSCALGESSVTIAPRWARSA
jgi:hypothetical protein